jgi:hypothetical protein
MAPATLAAVKAYTTLALVKMRRSDRTFADKRGLSDPARSATNTRRSLPGVVPNDGDALEEKPERKLDVE